MPKHAIAAGTALALCAGPALADLSAQDVWADWQRVYGAMGSELSADAAYGDGRLTLEDLSTTASYGQVETSTSYGTVTLAERPDGTVAIEIPRRLEIVTTTTLEGADQVQTIVMESERLLATIREEAGARIYDFSAGRIAYLFADDSGEVPATATVTLTLPQGTYSGVESGESLAFEHNIEATGLLLEVSSDGEGSDTFDLRYELDGLASDATGIIDLTASPETAALSQMGVVFDGDLTHSGSQIALNVTSEQSGPFQLAGTSEAGSIAFGLSEDALDYDLSSTGTEMTARMAAFPLPVTASLAELTSGFRLPVGMSDEPKPFGISLALRDLAVDDALWSLFDPTGQLPRDPATMVLDLDGTALMKADIFGDPQAMAAMTGPPGELKTLDLNRLLVSLAGAELSGDGSVTFPTASVVPQPVGTVTLALDGGLALVDRLVALGFLPQQQAAFAKGMVGMVAETVGEDQLRSVIAFTEGGGITANGMPLR